MTTVVWHAGMGQGSAAPSYQMPSPQPAGMKVPGFVVLLVSALLGAVVVGCAFALWKFAGKEEEPNASKQENVTVKKEPVKEAEPSVRERPGAPPAQGGSAPRPAVAVSASSSREPFRGISYAPGMATDGSMLTAWIEGAPGPGIGEWIRFDFGQEVRLSRVVIAPGYFKSPAVWAENNRVASAVFLFSNGLTRAFTFPDSMEVQTLELGGVPTRWVQIQIREVYFGNDPDTAISQVAFEWQ